MIGMDHISQDKVIMGRDLKNEKNCGTKEQTERLTRKTSFKVT